MTVLSPRRRSKSLAEATEPMHLLLFVLILATTIAQLVNLKVSYDTLQALRAFVDSP